MQRIRQMPTMPKWVKLQKKHIFKDMLIMIEKSQTFRKSRKCKQRSKAKNAINKFKLPNKQNAKQFLKSEKMPKSCQT